MSENSTTVKISHSKKIVQKDGEYQVKVTEYRHVFNLLERKWEDDRDHKITYEPLESWKGLSKTQEVQAIESRNAYDSELLPVSAFFLHTFKVTATSKGKGKDYYLTKANGIIIVNNLRTGVCEAMTLRDIIIPNEGLDYLIVKKAKPKKINEKEAQKLVGQGVPIVQMMGNEPVIRV